MQYADIAIARRLGGHAKILTYAIPPALLPDIAAGVIVDVPFRGSHVRGMIVGLRTHLAQPKLKDKLRPIHRVISPWPLLGAQELQLRTEIAHMTNSPVHLVASLLLPPPSLYRHLVEPAPESIGSGTLRYVIGNYTSSLQTLKSTLATKLAASQSIVILTSTKPLAGEVTEFVTQLLPAATVTHFDPQANVNKQQLSWKIVLGNRTGIIVGTRSAVLLPMRQSGLIIILDPADRQFEEEQVPRYQTFAVADLRRRIFGTDIVALGSLPPLALFTPTLRKSVILTRTDDNQPSIVISARNRPKVLQETTIDRVAEVTAAGERTIIVVPRRGWAAGLVCQECGTIIRCQNCGHLLHVNDATTSLNCEICRTTTRETRCPSCQSPRLTTFGWGSERFLHELQQLFPDLTISSDEAESLPANWQILVTTPERLGRSLVTAPLIVAVEPERILLSADYKAMETYLRQLFDLRERSKREFIIETRLPDQPAFQELQMELPREGLRTELALRKKHGYPPFGSLLTLIWQEDTTEDHRKYAELQVQIQALTSATSLIGPSQFTGKSGRQTNRLLVKVPPRNSQVLLQKIIGLLPTGCRWRIES